MKSTRQPCFQPLHCLSFLFRLLLLLVWSCINSAFLQSRINIWCVRITVWKSFMCIWLYLLFFENIIYFGILVSLKSCISTMMTAAAVAALVSARWCLSGCVCLCMPIKNAFRTMYVLTPVLSDQASGCKRVFCCCCFLFSLRATKIAFNVNIKKWVKKNNKDHVHRVAILCAQMVLLLLLIWCVCVCVLFFLFM